MVYFNYKCQLKSIEKSLSSGLSTLAGWDTFFSPIPWLVTVEFSSFVSARKVVRWFDFRSRKDDLSASSNIEGSHISATGSSSHSSPSSSSSSVSDSEDFFFENIFSLRL